MSPSLFLDVVTRLRSAGWQGDIDWSENVKPPTDADDFASEAIFVICNSGMKNTVARRIYDRVLPLMHQGRHASEGFGHKGKAQAITDIWRNRGGLFAGYMAATDKVEFCASLPWIGQITKFHLAKNFGADVAKPDVHLQRVADRAGETVQGLCERLAHASGFRTATVDVLIWRACAEGILNSRTGELRP